MATVIDTPDGITCYQMLAVKHGLKAIKIGLRLNRAYTPTNLRKMTEKLTGRKFKARDYDGMIAALEHKIDGIQNVHDDQCATGHAYPCNCAMAALKGATA